MLLSSSPPEAKAADKLEASPKTASANASKPLSAIEVYNEGVKLLMAGQTEQQRGETAQAETLFQRAEQAFGLALKTSNPKLVEAQSNLGYVQLYRKQYPQAIKQFKLALKLNPKHPETLQGLAMAYVQQHQAEKALPLFEQLTQLDPQNPTYWFNLGSTAQCLNLTQQAEVAYQEVLKLAPKQQAAVFNLATLKENTVNYKEALALYTGCIKIDAGSLIGLEAMKRANQLKSMKP
ncbi:MAG: tetratricopeptide repeat protein [Candidatus Melainabacteria bacterium]|nr:tetratricopeptide repeat protein [Candidatus Melainabacteria bacterium]